MEDLERVLAKLPHEAIKLIVVDGVFSMEGDLTKLPQIVELKHKYNCSVMVDEAHGIGVFGREGRGVCDHFGLTDEVDLIMGTFSKSRLLSAASLPLTSIPSTGFVTPHAPISSVLPTRLQPRQQHWRPPHPTEGAGAHRAPVGRDQLRTEALPRGGLRDR